MNFFLLLLHDKLFLTIVELNFMIDKIIRLIEVKFSHIKTFSLVCMLINFISGKILGFRQEYAMNGLLTVTLSNIIQFFLV